MDDEASAIFQYYRPGRARDLFCDAQRYYLKRSSFMDISRIERLRWRACELRHRLFDRWNEIARQILKQCGGYAFVPPLYRGSDPEMSDDFGNKARRRSLPRYFCVTEGFYGLAISFKTDYWDYIPAKDADRSSLHQLAHEGMFLQWEKEILPDRMSHVTDERLALGAQFHIIDTRLRRLSASAAKLAGMLTTALDSQGYLPFCDPQLAHGLDIVRINGRLYPFKRSAHDSTRFDGFWPSWGDHGVIDIESEFNDPQHLVKHSSEKLLIRYGEPILRLQNDSNTTWVYDKFAFLIKFNRVDRRLSADEFEAIKSTQLAALR